MTTRRRGGTPPLNRWLFEAKGPTDNQHDGKYWTADPNLAKEKLIHKAPTAGRKLAQLASGEVAEMARNTSLIFLNGVKQAKYHKAQDYHEVLDRGATVYVPGSSVPTFTVDGKVYGVELCLDHLYGSLKHPERLRGKAVDVVVLMSARVTLNPAQLPSNTAMAVHACSVRAESMVGRGGIHLAGSKAEKVEPGRYDIYSFDV